MQDEMKDEEARSVAAKETGEVPAGTADKMDVGVLDRKIAAATEDLDRLVSLRLLEALSIPPPHPLTTLSPSPHRSLLPRLDRVKIKVDKPKLWTGKYDWREREN
jgi:hypothetical protein